MCIMKYFKRDKALELKTRSCSGIYVKCCSIQINTDSRWKDINSMLFTSSISVRDLYIPPYL